MSSLKIKPKKTPKNNKPVQLSCVPSHSHLLVKARADAHAGLVPSLGWETMCSQPCGAPVGPPSRNDHAPLLRGVNELCRTTMGKGGLQREACAAPGSWAWRKGEEQ